MLSQLLSFVTIALAVIAPAAASPACANGQTSSSACYEACRAKMGWPGYYMASNAWGSIVVQTTSDIEAWVQDACAAVTAAEAATNSSCVPQL